MLLQGREYKLWYVDSEDKYSPDFLYIDRDGYACLLALDRKVGDFVEKQGWEMAGRWYSTNDSSMEHNKNCYCLKVTGRNPDTIVISNLQTADSMKIIDTGFPPNLYEHDIEWMDSDEQSYRKKMGRGIRQNSLLRGHDYQLWRSNEWSPYVRNPDEYEFIRYNPSLPDSFYRRHHTTIFPGGDTIFSADPLYYYCTFMYLDRYGKMDYIYLDGEEWRFLQPYKNNICCYYDVTVHYWYPVGSNYDTCGAMTVISGHGDSLHIVSKTGKDESSYVVVNLPPGKIDRVVLFPQKERVAAGDTVGIIKGYHIINKFIAPVIRDNKDNNEAIHGNIGIGILKPSERQ
jgi:hypothetical protein